MSEWWGRGYNIDEVKKWKNCKCWMILSQGCMKVWKSRRWQRPIQPWGVLVSANKFANRAVWWHLKPKKWSLRCAEHVERLKSRLDVRASVFNDYSWEDEGEVSKPFEQKLRVSHYFHWSFFLPNLLVHFNFSESIGRQWRALHRLVWYNYHEIFVAIVFQIHCLLTVV